MHLSCHHEHYRPENFLRQSYPAIWDRRLSEVNSKQSHSVVHCRFLTGTLGKTHMGNCFETPTPHTRQKDEQKLWLQNSRVCLVLKHLGSYFVQVTRAFLNITFVHDLDAPSPPFPTSKVMDFLLNLKFKDLKQTLRTLNQKCKQIKTLTNYEQTGVSEQW